VNLQNILLLYFDPSYRPSVDTSKYGQAMAAELMIFQGFYIRYGLNRNVTQPHLGTFGRGIGYGAGFNFPRLSLDFSIYRTMAPVYTNGKVYSMTILF
jgi:hypothetical protein